MFQSIQLANPNLSIDAIHDGRHDLGAKPLARESIPYIVVLPDDGIAFFTYTWVTKASVAGAAMAIFGPGVGSAPIQLRLADRPVPRDMNFDSWSIEGFRMEHDLKFDRAHVRWDTPEATIDFHFEASHPPYAYGSHPRGCPSYAADNRIEQAGRAKGTLRLGDRVISFDATSHRDHSWGTRDWLAMQHYEWFVGQAGNDVAGAGHTPSRKWRARHDRRQARGWLDGSRLAEDVPRSHQPERALLSLIRGAVMSITPILEMEPALRNLFAVRGARRAASPYSARKTED